ncbi:branched-chain amino acid transaminase [Pseudenhygromyxa sp. WMMC2535]|uniref:branched-chain amino acid transaminase n=1 Tax=Pseudenhygromyxa sp. WMMC2535 TaxID=2712867 RepID=UPI001552A211|nr:branched-chain amino acid transaminase [Pseudenhygromyxa sp. WMMC2535]NVB36296.1 branched-chain amino acid transaminase [Pseudenhygromyxa sp. WMMC2535]
MWIYLNGEFVREEDAKLSVRTRALNYGLGCFGGVRGYLADDGEQVLVFRLDAHVRRLERSAKILYLPIPGGWEVAHSAILEIIRRNEVHHDVYVRPMVVSGAAELAPVLREEDAQLIVWTMPLARYIDKDSIDVCVSSWRRTPDNAIPARTKPTGGYLNSALARREAKDNGFDEAIFLTEAGMVSEGSAEHVFLVHDGKLFSPPSTEDNLDGITRRSIITMATEDLGLSFVERPIGRTELYVADEMFLCGTGAQVTPVRSVDRRLVGDGGIGPITRRIHQYFQDVVHGRVEKRREWLTPIW